MQCEDKGKNRVKGELWLILFFPRGEIGVLKMQRSVSSQPCVHSLSEELVSA